MDLSSDIGIHPHSNKKSSWNSLHTALELLQTLGSELWFTNDCTLMVHCQEYTTWKIGLFPCCTRGGIGMKFIG